MCGMRVLFTVMKMCAFTATVDTTQAFKALSASSRYLYQNTSGTVQNFFFNYSRLKITCILHILNMTFVLNFTEEIVHRHNMIFKAIHFCNATLLLFSLLCFKMSTAQISVYRPVTVNDFNIHHECREKPQV